MPKLRAHQLLIAPFFLLCAIVFFTHPASAAEPPKENLHLFLLIGQSNMAGRGVPEAVDKTPHPRVWMLDAQNQWVPAVDPLHFDKPKIAGTGLSLTFAKSLADKNPSAHIGLIPCAFGGTPIAKWKKGEPLYSNAIARARLALQRGTLKGILWHQGEGDCGKRETLDAYPQNLAQFIRDLRADLKAPEAPFIAGQLGEFFAAKSPLAKEFNMMISKYPGTLPRTGCALATGLTDKGDQTHFDSKSLREFGLRYAAEYERIINSNGSAAGKSKGTAR
ncbi:MAG: sialate O-acetylesterase [Verrucomicrobiota bacterium]